LPPSFFYFFVSTHGFECKPGLFMTFWFAAPLLPVGAGAWLFLMVAEGNFADGLLPFSLMDLCFPPPPRCCSSHLGVLLEFWAPPLSFPSLRRLFRFFFVSVGVFPLILRCLPTRCFLAFSCGLRFFFEDFYFFSFFSILVRLGTFFFGLIFGLAFFDFPALVWCDVFPVCAWFFLLEGPWFSRTSLKADLRAFF